VQRGPRSDKRARARPIMGLRLELLAEFSSRPSKLGAWSLLAAAKSSFAGASKAATDTCSWPCASCIGGFHASVSLEGNCSNFRVEARPRHLMQRSGETRLQMRGRASWVKPVDSKGRWLWERCRRAEWARHRAETPEMPEPWCHCTHRRSSLGTLSASAKPTTTCLQ
jgi:hypothetical protein